MHRMFSLVDNGLNPIAQARRCTSPFELLEGRSCRVVASSPQCPAPEKNPCLNTPVGTTKVIRDPSTPLAVSPGATAAICLRLPLVP